MNHFRNYSSPPTQPFTLPISSHPPAVPCAPGAKLAEGSHVSRGGVFEGASMAEGESHCGYWSDNVGDVNLWQQGYPASRPAPPYHLNVVPSWPPETPARFQPREINLGFARSSRSGFGTSQFMVPMAITANRSRNIWTGPLRQRQTSENLTPRGGVLDGNTIQYRGQGAHSAYYYGESPRVLQPGAQIEVLPNPLSQKPVPVVGWGLGAGPDGLGR